MKTFAENLLKLPCLEVDGFTFGTLLNACGNLGWLRIGREVHGKVVTLGIED